MPHRKYLCSHATIIQAKRKRRGGLLDHQFPRAQGKTKMKSGPVARGWNQVCVKENPATYVVSDAAFALKCARSANDRKNEEETTRFARMAILLHAVSLEAFINFVYEYSEVPATRWRNLSLRDKWLRAALECLPCSGELETERGVVYCLGDPIETFGEDAEPFVSFLELKAFRDCVVHLKPPFVMVAHDEIDRHLGREEYYPVTGLPRLLQHSRIELAEVAERVYQAMTEELNRQMKGTVLRMFEIEAVLGSSPWWMMKKTPP
jgi:hypothetical protein